MLRGEIKTWSQQKESLNLKRGNYSESNYLFELTLPVNHQIRNIIGKGFWFIYEKNENKEEVSNLL